MVFKYEIMVTIRPSTSCALPFHILPLEQKIMTRNKRSSEEWFSLISECQSSGLTVRDFCSHKGIHPSNFYYWVKRQRTSSVHGFVPVTITKACNSALLPQVEIVYPNGVSLKLSSVSDMRMISQLIRL